MSVGAGAAAFAGLLGIAVTSGLKADTWEPCRP
jgi:hypothetical protein